MIIGASSFVALTFFCRYGFLLNVPEAFEEENGLYEVFPSGHSRSEVGDVVTFESWNTIHCNPVPKAGESRKVVFWYSFEEVIDGVDVDHQLNPWTLHSMLTPNFETSMVRFFLLLNSYFLTFFTRVVQCSLQHGLYTSPTATFQNLKDC